MGGSTVASIGETLVLRVDDDGPVLDGRGVRDILAEAFAVGARVVAIPARRLDPAFFDLRSRVAGDILQLSATYRVILAVIGEPPGPASSSAFAALVRESNAGSDHWFLPSDGALRERLEGRRG